MTASRSGTTDRADAGGRDALRGNPAHREPPRRDPARQDPPRPDPARQDRDRDPGRADADRAVLRKAVARLTDRLPDLADRLAAEILSGDDGDRSEQLRADLWEVCRVGLGHGFEVILDPARGRTDLDWARRLGRRRAHQGQPLDQLLRSYRLAGRVFWEAVVEAVGRHDPGNVPALVRQATRTWDTIDEQSGAAAAAYHQTELSLARRSEERVQAIVDALLDGQGADGGLLATAASVLGLPAAGRYAVVMLGAEGGFESGFAGGLDGEFSGELAGGRDRRPGDIGGMRFIWRLRADAQVALVALGTAELDDLVDAVRPYARSHAGVSPVVHNLAELGGARWLAELALRTCRGPGSQIARLDRRLPDALVLSQPRLAGRLGDVALGGLTGVDPAFRDVLLATLTAWLDCDGSAARAADRLFCHRNTVLNRLRKIEQLTGRTLAHPRDLVEIALALSAVRLHGPAPR
ncbi:helix-turn-helix domain-containing protein [Actinomadura nitritigenes]|uniref:Helix-turn-helix domain-containing protein n=1 Tax=Actinomadura nitritigenes TaxID=134602 RepID=A0ABS3QX24_9ACTN|nr:helix-turn-helix domain-containing protein [Actinomadura nitritigenes]MBO2438536.1 helix-turn-helix domain-containing protein [Actinomadura nitritigenes]